MQKLILKSLIFIIAALGIGAMAVADSFTEQFEQASARRFSPGIVLDFSALPTETYLLEQRVKQLAEEGFNSILLQSVPADSGSWLQITRLAAHCRTRSMQFGCAFFSPSAVEGSEHLLRRIGWSRIEVDMQDYTAERRSLHLARRGDIAPFANVLTPAAPISESPLAGNVIAGRDPLPAQGAWYDFSFSAMPVRPLTVDYLNQKVFPDAVNGFLLQAQQQLDRNYGTVLDWVWLRSIPSSELVWTEGAERWFSEHLSLDLVRYLPVLAGVDLRSPEYSQTIRQRYQQGVRQLWRERFAGNVKSLIQEAGLNAGVRIDEIPLDPEEAGSCFGMTVLSSTPESSLRLRNRRAAGGARVAESKSILGLIDSGSAQELRSAVDALLVDGADRILFDEKISDFQGCDDFAVIDDFADYIRRTQFVLQNSKHKSDFLLCADTLPVELNQYSFDCANVTMLREAEITDGHLIFPSGRSYATVVFGEAVLRTPSGAKVAADLESGGVSVLRLAGDADAAQLSEQEITAVQRVRRLGEIIPNRPELLPDMTWIADQSSINIRFVHNSNPQRDFYLIKNESRTAGMVTLTFRMADFARVRLWQPMDGRIYEISKMTRIDKYHTSIPVPVRPGELFFIVFEH